MRCFVYRNLHKPGYVYSLKAMEGPYKGRIIGYCTDIIIFDAEFKVYTAGQARVRRENRKNVHAGIVGHIRHTHNYEERLCPRPDADFPVNYINSPLHGYVTYNPYKYDTFIDRTEQLPVHKAERVYINEHGVFARGISR